MMLEPTTQAEKRFRLVACFPQTLEPTYATHTGHDPSSGVIVEDHLEAPRSYPAAFGYLERSVPPHKRKQEQYVYLRTG